MFYNVTRKTTERCEILSSFSWIFIAQSCNNYSIKRDTIESPALSIQNLVAYLRVGV